jgi:hypothetical protein
VNSAIGDDGMLHPWRSWSLWLRTGATFAGVLLLGGCAGGGSAGGASPSSSVRPTASASSRSISDAENSCDKRGFASGDIYVRMITPGLSPQAQELGGEWTWNATLQKCETSVQMTISTAPLTTGNCTQVGYVADNPGYDPNATPAAPLKSVAAQAGPAC